MAVTARAVLIGVVVAVAAGGCNRDDKSSSCPPRFDTRQWEASGAGAQRVRLARELTACGFVRSGDTREHVAAVLGRAERDETQYRSEYRREWLYYLDETNSAMGPAFSRYLSVRFTRESRVRDVSVDP
jgi:hypothetical protein